MHTIADDEDQGGPVHRSVPVGQEGFAGARMRDLRRDSGRRELENSHGDVFLFGVGGSTRAGEMLRAGRVRTQAACAISLSGSGVSAAGSASSQATAAVCIMGGHQAATAARCASVSVAKGSAKSLSQKATISFLLDEASVTASWTRPRSSPRILRSQAFLKRLKSAAFGVQYARISGMISISKSCIRLSRRGSRAKQDCVVLAVA